MIEPTKNMPSIDDDIQALLDIDQKFNSVSHATAQGLSDSGPQDAFTVTALAARGALSPQVPIRTYDEINTAWDRQDEQLQRGKLDVAADACQVLSDRARSIKAFIDSIPVGPQKEKYIPLAEAADAAIAALESYTKSRDNVSFGRMHESLQHRIENLENIFRTHAPRLIRAYKQIPKIEN